MTVLDTPAAGASPDRSGGVAHRLVVAWQHPVERSISPVGLLTYDGSVYGFTYIRNALQVKDFRPLLGFDDLHRSYNSGTLFPLFAQRAMDPRRADYQRYVERLGLEGEPGPWEQIARSQGRRQGDTLQLLPEPTLADNALSGLFLVNGMRHAFREPRILDDRTISVTREQVEAVLAELEPGDELGLAHESGNPVNPLALMVLGASVPVGWVPDLLVEDMQVLLKRAHVSVTVAHVNGPDAPWHLRLLARLHAAPANGFRFFTGERWTPLAEAPALSVGEHVRIAAKLKPNTGRKERAAVVIQGSEACLLQIGYQGIEERKQVQNVASGVFELLWRQTACCPVAGPHRPLRQTYAEVAGNKMLKTVGLVRRTGCQEFRGNLSAADRGRLNVPSADHEP